MQDKNPHPETSAGQGVPADPDYEPSGVEPVDPAEKPAEPKKDADAGAEAGYYMEYGISGHARFHSGGSLRDEAAQRCGLKFNPGGHAATERIKVACAAAMKTIIDEREQLAMVPGGQDVTEEDVTANWAMLRCMATALTHLEAAQMFAVKGLHTRANAGLK